ncbi:MAG TPA: phosphomannomutase/phosphoglucomutase [Stellaceae bacterium]|nr:phosphomannomutase/phosphoglucomutase [Stellaceae bacterium]
MANDAGRAGGHRFDPTILREYDIRGTVDSTLFIADARALGRAFAVCMAEVGGKRAAVGRDGRLHSPALEQALVQGLTESGIDVARIGLGPTPMLYYAASTLGVDAGLMVTGSHNPPDQNGFKLVLQKRSFFGADIQRVGEIAAAARFRTGTGKVSTVALLDEYVARLTNDYDGKRPLTVVWDAGNGATGQALVRLTGKLPGKHILLNEAIDGRFPAHHPDPTEAKNLAQIQAAVKQHHADLGIAFDGDGDRIGVVDAQGRILWGDQLMTVLAADVIREKPGATIIADVKASQVLFDEIARVGGTPLMWRTGHSIIKAKMAEIGAPLAGEMSGHIFYADRYYGYDDALYAGVRLIGILGRGDASLAELRDRLPQVVNTPELRFPCEESRKFAVVSEVRDRLKAAGAEMSDIDGVRVKTADGWWLLRASNTQAVLVARAEARDAAALERLKQALARELKASGVAPPTF